MEIIGVLITLVVLGLYITGLSKSDEYGEEIIRKNKESREKWKEELKRELEKL